MRLITNPKQRVVLDSLSTVDILMNEIPNPLLFAEAEKRAKLQESRIETFLVLKMKANKKMEVIKNKIEEKEYLVNRNDINEKELGDVKNLIKRMIGSVKDDLEVMNEMHNCVIKDEDPFLFLGTNHL